MKPLEEDMNNDQEFLDNQLREDLERELKLEVNKLLYDKLPSTMTLGEFEKLAVAIHNLIMDSWS